jgi:hypothetical protein
MPATFTATPPATFAEIPLVEGAGHRIWRIDGVVWIADESGESPHSTDDGPIAYDPTRPTTVRALRRFSDDVIAMLPVYVWRMREHMHAPVSLATLAAILRRLPDEDPEILVAYNDYSAIAACERARLAYRLYRLHLCTE